MYRFHTGSLKLAHAHFGCSPYSVQHGCQRFIRVFGFLVSHKKISRSDYPGPAFSSVTNQMTVKAQCFPQGRLLLADTGVSSTCCNAILPPISGSLPDIKVKK